MRFLYCACAISAILSDPLITVRPEVSAPAATTPVPVTEAKSAETSAPSANMKFPFDVEKAVRYVRSCQVGAHVVGRRP